MIARFNEAASLRHLSSLDEWSIESELIEVSKYGNSVEVVILVARSMLRGATFSSTASTPTFSPTSYHKQPANRAVSGILKRLG